VRADKLREVRAGHDGTWVAHPGLVSVAKDVFDEHMPGANQIGVRGYAGTRADGDAAAADPRTSAPAHPIAAADLLRIPEGPVTEKGVRQNINVGILYLAAWLDGHGAVPLYNLMEDAATAEISRTQLWQWLHHGATLDDGRRFTRELYEQIRDEELRSIGERPHVETAADIFNRLVLDDELADFLTIPAYRELLEIENKRRTTSQVVRTT
jgi:malate synthase